MVTCGWEDDDRGVVGELQVNGRVITGEWYGDYR